MSKNVGLAISYNEAMNTLLFCDSYTRLGAILDMVGKLAMDEWLKVLGEEWSTCDNIAAYYSALKKVLPKNGPVREMMDDNECLAFSALPETLTVYRGCGPRNRKGASWTLERDVAVKFPFFSRYEVESPLLISATVEKSNVLAFKQGRNESEIITFSAVPFAVEPIPVKQDC